MSIVTKKGDAGKTSLYLGGRVSKDDPRIELIGTLDEVSSFLGASKGLSRHPKVRRMIDAVQKDLFFLGTEAATPVSAIRKLRKRISRVEIKRLEAWIAGFEAGPSSKFSFVLPGENFISSSLDVARALARRAERRATTLLRKGVLKNSSFLVYLNRLSDLLYLLARFCEKDP